MSLAEEFERAAGHGSQIRELSKALTAANARIRELEKERDDLVFWKGHYERTENVALTAERAISDKLLLLLEIAIDSELSIKGKEEALKLIAELKAMRKGERG